MEIFKKPAREAFYRLFSLVLLLAILAGSGPGLIRAYAGSGDEPQPTTADPTASSGASSVAGSNKPLYLPLISNKDLQVGAFVPSGDGWPMAGANPQRTSWTSEEVTGELRPEWVHPFDAYLSQRIQIIASGGYLFLAAADGLHALDAASGAEAWFFPTPLPPGHSPTIAGGLAFLGTLDGRVYALDAASGSPVWSFTASAGFQTNPLVVDGRLFAGARDGSFYALEAASGRPLWQFQAGGPVLFSAAYADGAVYFAANDNHAYALDAASGSLQWKSDRLPGHGFFSYWPVVFGEQVIFPAAYNYRYPEPFSAPHTTLDTQEAFPAGLSEGDPIGPLGQAAGPWVDGTQTLDARPINDYFERFPHRRTLFVLDRRSGREVSFDSDGDGQAEYAPFLWFGTHSGTRYPPVLAPDGSGGAALYAANALFFDPYIPRGRISAWKPGSSLVSVPDASATAVDEPLAYAVGGNTIYYKRCCDRMAGAFQVAGVNRADELGKWTYYDEGGLMLRQFLPELFARGWDYAYWKHGDQSPPIPYQGRVYLIANNAVVALSPQGAGKQLDNPQGGQTRGQPAGELEYAQGAWGANALRLTADGGHFPRLLGQETYYEPDTRPEARGRYFRLLDVAPLSGSPGGLEVSAQPFGAHFSQAVAGGRFESWVSERAPQTLFHNPTNGYKLGGQISHLAYPADGGVQVLSGSGSVPGSALSAGWLLAWDNSGEHRWRPFVISLEHRPNQINFSSSGINLSYSGAAGHLAVTPLYGLSSPVSSEANAWASGIPSGTLERVRLLDRVARAYPENGSQGWSNSGGDATLSLRYTAYRTFPGDWNTAPLKLAYLPPQVALAGWTGLSGSSPMTVNGQPFSAGLLDLGFVTPLGRIAGRQDADRAEVRLPGAANLWQGDFSPKGAPKPGDPAYEKLVEEVQQMVDAGHLLPAYGNTGIWDVKADHRLGDSLADVWHNPADTVYTLLQALPWLPGDLQARVKSYVQQEASSFPLWDTAHTGWANGRPREGFDLPPEVAAAAAGIGPSSKTSFNGWELPPQNFYALSLYAAQFGNARALFDQARGKLDLEPQFEQSLPYVLNSYLAGYIGYLRLANLAGAGPQPAVETLALDLLVMRAALSKYPAALEETGFEYAGYAWTLRKVSPDQDDTLFIPVISGSLWSQLPLYGFKQDPLYGLSGASTGGDYAFGLDFVNLVPETATFLRSYALEETRAAVESYTRRAPYWFVAKAAETGGEGVLQPLYDRWAYFQATAGVLGASRAELEGFVDVPAVPLGDLYYLQNLVSLLKTGQPPGAPATGATSLGALPEPNPAFAGAGSIFMSETASSDAQPGQVE